MCFRNSSSCWLHLWFCSLRCWFCASRSLNLFVTHSLIRAAFASTSFASCSLNWRCKRKKHHYLYEFGHEITDKIIVLVDKINLTCSSTWDAKFVIAVVESQSCSVTSLLDGGPEAEVHSVDCCSLSSIKRTYGAQSQLINLRTCPKSHWRQTWKYRLSRNRGLRLFPDCTSSWLGGFLSIPDYRAPFAGEIY